MTQAIHTIQLPRFSPLSPRSARLGSAAMTPEEEEKQGGHRPPPPCRMLRRLPLLILPFSLLLNLLLLFPPRLTRITPPGSEPHRLQLLTWTYDAASEAEAVAAVNCSGHGRAFLDGVIAGDDGRPSCECNACYRGRDCSLLLPDCAANADRYGPGRSRSRRDTIFGLNFSLLCLFCDIPGTHHLPINI